MQQPELKVDDITDVLDQLSIQDDQEFLKLFSNGRWFITVSFPWLESIFVSCKVKKYNQFDWKQERIFVVTEKHIYNIKGKSRSHLPI